MIPRNALRLAAVALASAAMLTAPAEAADPSYKGRTLTVVVGYGPAASYDLYSRLLSRHIGRHLSGNPTVVVQNMPGGSSLRAANYLYNAAAKDGSVVGVIRNGMALEQLYGRPGIKFDALKFNWIGSLTRITGACTVWHAAPATTIEEAKKKEIVAGAIGTQGSIAVYPRALNDMLGTKFKVVLGYTSAGIVQAMEQGEVHSRCGGDWHSLTSSHGHLIRDGKIRILAQMTNKRALPDQPWIFDYVKKEEDVQVLRLIFASQDWGQPVVAPPGVPKAHVAALRTAFDAAMKDKALLAEAERTKLRIDDPMPGAEIQSLLEGYHKTPKSVLDRVSSYGKPGSNEGKVEKKKK
jgi:tripartite-type tricarboxylate transporter receptor subunit TctC